MIYDVALWLFWPSLFPEYIAIIESSDPLSAVLVLMESCEVSRVSLAAVRLPDGSLRRWFGVRCSTRAEIV